MDLILGYALTIAQPDQMLIRPDYMPSCGRSMTVNNRFLS